MFYRLQLYREGNHVVYHHHYLNLCIHVETTTLADGTYELVPESESEQREAQANLTEAVEDPGQRSDDPRTNFAQEGKPRSITLFLSQIMQLITLLLVH